MPETWRTLQLSRVNHSVGFVTDPFWLSVLSKAYRLQVHDLVTKARVPIPRSDGCRVLGIPDPAGVLAEGEIFLLCEYKVGTDTTRLPVVGDVMVYRNPCLHPGDVQRLKAVDKPCLRPYRNVLVLPTVGRRSVAACCSGGDLDGDVFSVIWATDLVPPPGLTHPALDYDELARKAAEDAKSAKVSNDPSPPFSGRDLATFFCTAATNDTLGKIAHMHLAQSDHSPRGALDPDAMKLAEAQSLAVDFPKTGVPPRVPKRVKTDIDRRGYPDFMQKMHRRMYTSCKTLGKMFRRCVSLDVDYECAALCDVDEALLLPGRAVWQQSACAVYRQYKRELGHLLALYGLTHEAEAVLGIVRRLSTTDYKASERIHAHFQHLMDKYREKFFVGLKPGDKWSKCSAWYEAAYRPTTATRSRSFVWCVGDILCEIKKGPSAKPEDGVHVIIGRDALVSLSKQMSILQPIINSRLNAARYLQQTLQAHCQRQIKMSKG